MSEAEKKEGWGRGFVWGCLTPLIVVGAIIVGLIGYAGYYALFSYKSDNAFQTVLADVRASATARELLGNDIDLSGFPGYSFSYSSETGHTASYHFTVKGSKGEGTIQSDLRIVGDKIIVRSLVLTAPNGLHYDLLTGKGNSSQHSIRYIAPRRLQKPIPT